MRVLFVGCHCDDIELGCGATINKHKDDWEIFCVCFSRTGPFGTLKQLKKQSEDALKHLGASYIKHLDYPTNDFWIHRQNIWESLNDLNSEINPDLIFSHMSDEHQDHVVLFEETIRNFKEKNVLCYKPTLAYGMSHCWNYIEKISRLNLDVKIEACKFFKDYLNKVYFDPNVIESQARIMGANSLTEIAEAFQVYRIIKH